MGNWKIGTGAGGGGKFDKQEHEGHLVYAVGITSAPAQETAYGTSDAAHCDYFGCVECNLVIADYMLFGTALVPVFVEDAEHGFEVVAGRLVKGRASGGQNPPWLLDSPDDAELEKVAAWLDEHASRLKSGKIVLEDAAPADAASTDDEPF